MYDRKIGEHTLNFEASGALMKASLVMRDRETDSWWSIMTSDAIGGELVGAELDELPVGRKTTWRAWVEEHPHTQVLSIDGREHEPINPYDEYFSSKETFRNLEIADDRLPPKEPIFSFRWQGQPLAVAHSSIAGGHVFEAPNDDQHRFLFYREPGSSIFASTSAWVIDVAAFDTSDLSVLLEATAESGFPGISIDGFDTFWYSWVAVNTDSGLLR